MRSTFDESRNAYRSFEAPSGTRINFLASSRISPFEASRNWRKRGPDYDEARCPIAFDNSRVSCYPVPPSATRNSPLLDNDRGRGASNSRKIV